MQNIFEFRYLIGYKKDDIFRPLCIILLQMSGYIKYFETVEKICRSQLKMMMCWLNIMKFGTRLKRH